MRVLIVGLPLFAKRLQEDLSSFDPENTYYCLDTYYNKWHKIKAYFLIPRVDVVYSINGTLNKSRVFDRAIKLKKKLMMTWVGTDVTKTKKLTSVNELYLNYAHHYCEVEWIQKELKELNIGAQILNFFNFKEKKELQFPDSKQLSILCYISKNREKYYGWDAVIHSAIQNPNVSYHIVGTEGLGDQPSNVHCHGWVSDMEPYFNEVHCTIRFVEHDGLSGFVLESLYRGKQVLYSEPLTHCIYVKNDDELSEQIATMSNKLMEGEDLLNVGGADYIDQNFSREKILTNLIEEMKS